MKPTVVNAFAPGAYDPPAELEGPNNGLVEALAARLWEQRGRHYHRRGATFDRDAGPQTKDQWRTTARMVLSFMFELGFVGPAGAPEPPARNYCWNNEANKWEVLDSDGGFVALVREPDDVPIFIAAARLVDAVPVFLEATDAAGVIFPDSAVPALHSMRLALKAAGR